MGYRDRDNNERSGAYDFCIMEVRLKKKSAAPGTKEDLRMLMVDSHWETLHYVQDNMQEFIANVVRLRRMESKALAFRNNLEPLLSTLRAANGEGVMDKLSSPLKKALLQMVMERFHSDREKACRMLGISREKLDSELRLCGVAF